MSNRYFCLPALARLLELRQGPDPLSWRAFGVGVVLASFADETGTCYPSRAAIAERANLHPRNVSRALRELEAKGGLNLEKRRGRVNLYHLTLAKTDRGAQVDTPVEIATPPLAKTGPTPLTNLPPGTNPRTKPRTKAALAQKTEARKPNVWAWWIDANGKAGRRDPVREGKDLGAARELGKMIQAGELSETELRESLQAYLKDADPWLTKQGHPLRLLPGRLNGYLNSGVTRMTPAQVEASLRMRDLEDLLAREGKL